MHILSLSSVVVLGFVLAGVVASQKMKYLVHCGSIRMSINACRTCSIHEIDGEFLVPVVHESFG
jgi:hypothetical protein